MTSLEKAFDYIDQLIRQRMKEANLPGWAAAVTDRQKLLWASCHGYADTGAKLPITPDSLFEIGSIGKSFTCIALLQLVEEGILNLHAPVSHYLPWFEVGSKFPPITVHHIMRHTAGLIRGTEQAPHGIYDCWDLRDRKCGSPPGARWHYSSIGYKVLGLLLEQITGQTYPEVIHSRIFGPLGMSSSHPAVTFDTRRISTIGYRGFYDDRPQHPTFALAPAMWSEYATADGCQASTIGDMAAYLRMLLNRGKGPQGPVMSEASFRMLTEPEKGAGNNSYAYALAQYPVDEHTYIGHGGVTPGYNNFIMVDLDSGLGVVSMVNKMEETDAVEATTINAMTALRRAYYGRNLPPVPTSPDPTSVSNASDYVGEYRCAEHMIRLAAEQDRLVIHCNGQYAVLSRRGEDNFYVGHPDFGLFLLEFKREGGKVVEAFHGAQWYTNANYSGPRRFDYPAHWEAYVGHYRARNPELSNFRVVIRKGALFLILPWGLVEPLLPLTEDYFRIGQDSGSPETLRFQAIVEGQSLRGDFSGCPYYRTFTP